MDILREFNGDGYHAELEDLPDQEFLRLTIHGKYHAGSNQELIQTTKQEADARGYRKCLVDYRDAEVSMSVLEIVRRPKEFAEVGMERSFQSALVFDPAKVDIDLRFLENYFYNRSWYLRCFDDIEEALAWLRD